MWVPELEVGDFKSQAGIRKTSYDKIMIVVLEWVPNLQIPYLKG